MLMRSRDQVRQLLPQLYTITRGIFEFLVLGIVTLFTIIAQTTMLFLNILTIPFRNQQDNHNLHRYEVGVDIEFRDYGEQVRFAILFVIVVILVMCIGLVYADISGIPRARTLIGLAGACTFWGVVAIYLLFLFRPLGRIVSQIIAYVVAFFLSLIFGAWLINLKIIDAFLQFLGQS